MASRFRKIEIDASISLADYEVAPHLAPAVRALRDEAAQIVPRLGGRRSDGGLAVPHRARPHHPTHPGRLGVPPPLGRAVRPGGVLDARVHPVLPGGEERGHRARYRPPRPQEPGTVGPQARGDPLQRAPLGSLPSGPDRSVRGGGAPVWRRRDVRAGGGRRRDRAAVPSGGGAGLPLLRAFARLKSESFKPASDSARHLRRLRIVRLVLAGPDPASIQDDPESRGVLEELCRAWRALPDATRRDVAIVTLPMANRKRNALMVNALQRCGTIVVQNSLQEGFGLTVTEAMWKRAAVVSTHACGPRHQIRDGLDGVLVRDPEDPVEIAGALDRLLADAYRPTRLGERAQLRVHEEFLVFRQAQAWLRCLDRAVRTGRG